MMNGGFKWMSIDFKSLVCYDVVLKSLKQISKNHIF